MVQRVAALRVGDPSDATTTVGPLKLGKAAVAGLQAQVRDAVTKGAKVIAGYGAPASAPGAIGAAAGAKHEAIMVPTVVVDCTHDMTIVQQESFGPVVALLCVGSDAEAIALMNDSHLGLTGGVFTASAAAAEAVLSQLQVPMYWLCCCNCLRCILLHTLTHARLPGWNRILEHHWRHRGHHAVEWAQAEWCGPFLGLWHACQLDKTQGGVQTHHWCVDVVHVDYHCDLLQMPPMSAPSTPRERAQAAAAAAKARRVRDHHQHHHTASDSSASSGAR